MYAYQLTATTTSQPVFPHNVDSGAGSITNLSITPVLLKGGFNLPSMTPYSLGAGETVSFPIGSEGIGGLTAATITGAATLNIILHSVTYLE